jgi:hypothetical protein
MLCTSRRTARSGWLFARTSRFTRVGLIAVAMMPQLVLGQEAMPSSDMTHAVPIERTEGDVVFTDYTFRDGEKVPQLRIHYITLGHKHLNARGEVDNAILLLHWTNASSQALVTPEFQRALFAPGSPLDVSRYFIVIPDDQAVVQRGTNS